MSAARSTLASHLLRAWQTRGPTAWALRPLAALYGALLRLRRWRYQCGHLHSTQLPVPVLVVGNVVVGGTGKTPTVAALVQHLQARGWRPGIVSRGYGASGAGDAVHAVSLAQPQPHDGDEPRLLARLTGVPVWVGRQRVAAASALLQRHPEVNLIVSDDGMQHWPLARDLTIVVFDERSTGNGWLLPAGLLREPWPAAPWGGGAMLVLRNLRHNATRHAVAPLHSPYPVFVAWRQLADHAINRHGHRQPLQRWAHPQDSSAPPALAALAGIAQPEVFFDMLRAQGLVLQHTMALPDHASDAELLSALTAGCTWLCTEKDAVKLFPLLAQRPGAPEVWAVPLQQNPEPGFFAAVDACLEKLSSAHGRQTT